MFEQRKYTDIKSTAEDRIVATGVKGEKVIVFLTSAPKLNKGALETCIAEMAAAGIPHAIIVYKDGVTACTGKTIQQLGTKRIELFAQEDLQYNVTKHRLQPEFERLSPKEAETFRKRFNVDHFPTMRFADPVARFLDYRRNDIIKITTARGARLQITFRIVKG